MDLASPKSVDREWLPPHLSERVRVIQQAPIRPEADFVLYWMHHAVRSHENPALDTALCVAHRYNLPVLVYQGLGGPHPFNSDRHHTFIMEGARDVQSRLQEKGVKHLFYLGRQATAPSPLRALARRAALVITEEFPAPPFTQWTRQLALQVKTAMWAVDCACLIPMRLINRSFARAFEFRNHTQKEYTRRLSQAWEEMDSAGVYFNGDCGFASIDLADADIAELCAQCDIDHTIFPVTHTPGGSTAGYERWQQFKQNGLNDYARLRNDAAVMFPQGVSRLSAYLHHGHVSPFRIARDAFISNLAGSAKFIDELLIWRELAHNFCFHHPILETLDILPQWARETLRAHTGDSRPAVYSWETLYRGQTGDKLWDAAQQSLRIHGELHNNLRMTWGKALLHWTPTPEEALRLMIDLNHRFALDGNDPNSYGGLLWCLGLFDRPFKPEQPIIGSLRPRSTRAHAKRLDMPAYLRKIKGPTSARPINIAVIGAGLSGLFAARTLSDHGHPVRIFETADRPGGRIATQRNGSMAFDTGAQYFTVRDDRFKRYVQSWQTDGIVAPWKGKVVVIKDGAISDERRLIERWVSIPSMDTIAAHLAHGIELQLNRTIVSISKQSRQWQLLDQQRNTEGPFDAVVIAVPPPHADTLAAANPAMLRRISSVKMQPSLAVMVAFEKPLKLPFDAAFVHDSPLSWIARNNSKPNRPPVECWVLHANAVWTQANHNRNADQLERRLIDAFFGITGLVPLEPVYHTAHYWRSAQATHPLNQGALWDTDQQLGFCGDWCQMSRIEGAALSGMAVAGRIMGALAGVDDLPRERQSWKTT